MRIVFGMQLDGSVWSDEDSSIGVVKTGPLGLLSILETRLGTGRELEHPVHRIDQYMKRLQLIDRESIWFHKSFSIDQWSTARQLLEWRDELVEAGWDGCAISSDSPRLAALVELESVESTLSYGQSDRLRSVIKSLKSNMPAHIESIILTEPLIMLPLIWQSVLELLKSQGTTISYLSIPVSKPQTSNLSYIKSEINGIDGQNTLSPDDDSLILLKSENEWEAAEHLALWLASEYESNDQVAIICGMDTSILDQVLKRHSLPSLGRTTPSKWRELQQILPLTLANAWQPVDIRLIVELLSLTLSVLPRWACKRLLKAIAEEPGVGGRAWSNALIDITERQKEFFDDKDDPEAKEKAEALIEIINELLVNNRFISTDGIPEDKLRERCQMLIERLAWRVDEIPMLAEVISQAREIQSLSMGKGVIPRVMLERMLDTVIGTGNALDDMNEEAAPWRVFDHPGQITDSCSNIIWWGFNAPPSSSLTYWSPKERLALSEYGIILQETKSFRSRKAYEWQQGFMCADKRFMAIYISRVDGEDVEHHPYWDTILSAALKVNDDTPEEIVKSCICKKSKDFSNTGDWKFAGRKSLLERVKKSEAYPVTAYYTVPRSSIKKPETLSYTQMSTLIGCPFKWTLQYHAKLRKSESQSIPTDNQMIGTFCHRIVEDLYAETTYQDAADAYEKAGQLFDSLIPSMASELLLEGSAAERQRYRTSITEAVYQLVTAINRLNLSVEKTEALLEGAVDGIPYKGFTDILLRDSAGHPFVLDMKWSSSINYRKKEVEEGASLQLAAYAWMLRSAEPSHQVHAGYFMLTQGRLLSSSPMLADESINTPYTLEEIWNMGVASMNNTIDNLETGTVEVRGLVEKGKAQELNITEEKAVEKIKEEHRRIGMLYQSPPCMFCDYIQLCGMQEGVI